MDQKRCLRSRFHENLAGGPQEKAAKLDKRGKAQAPLEVADRKSAYDLSCSTGVKLAGGVLSFDEMHEILCYRYVFQRLFFSRSRHAICFCQTPCGQCMRSK